MDWTAASAIAEIVGAIAVVASLIYIATQIRQNSDLLRQNIEIARSTIIHETSAMYVGMHAQIAQNEELADIYRRGMDNESLDETEQVRYIALIQMALTALEDTEFHYTSGLYFVEDDDERFSEKVISLLEDDELREKIGRNGQNFVRKNHGMEKRHKLIEESYINVFS